MRRYLSLLLAIILFTACGLKPKEESSNTIYVTITPLKAIIEEITCGDFTVEVIVPDGASPETYEPTAKQLTKINEAQMIFSTGLINFEQSIVEHIDNKSKVVNLSDGIELIEGSCSHHHHHHSHGVDPHIWTSPKSLRIMVMSARDAIMEEFPDNEEYAEAAARLLERIDALDAMCKQQIDNSGVKAIMIYHPAYTYYARDYDIEQIAIEHDGKEPTPKQLTALCNKGKEMDIDVIFHQPQYSADKVSAIASEIDAEVVETDPLAEDILSEIERITTIICRNNEQ